MAAKKASNQKLLFTGGAFRHRLQAFSTALVYFVSMLETENSPVAPVDLAGLRENAGLTVRGLARELGINHTTVLKWERTGKVAKTEFLVPMSQILGVTIEELLGQPKPRRATAPGGKLGQVFRDVSEMPRRKQQQVIEVVEALIDKHQAKAS
jgi:transcriptional regulator with XRE-family HTH domain